MLQEVLNTYKNIYKNPLLNNTIHNHNEQNNTFDLNKDTEFLLSKITPDSSCRNRDKEETKIKKTKNINISEPKYLQEKYKHKHENCLSCFKCHPYFRMLKKQKNNLVNFINNSKTRNIKLIGNNRYSHTSPKKYVFDNNKRLPSRKIGIIPLPLNKKKNKTLFEAINYHELQRSIVMMRRIQYDRKIRKGELYNYLEEVIFIQRWWKNLKIEEKVRKIQKIFRKYLNRKKLKIRKKLKETFPQIKNIFNVIIYKYSFNKIKRCKYMKKPKINYYKPKKNRNRNNYFYSSKSRKILSIDSIYKLNDIQNNYRLFKAIQKKNELLKEKRLKPINIKNSYFTKITINENILNEKINILQRNIKYFLYENKKKNILKIDKKNERLGFFINKIFISTKILKIIQFNIKLRHIMQLNALKKRTKYKSLKYYSINDINKINQIQKIYKLHYNKNHINKKDLIKIYSTKFSINCYITKKVLKKNNKALLLMQKFIKYNLERIRFEKNIIKNKPKSIDFNKNINNISIQKVKNLNLEISNGIDKNNNNYSQINNNNNFQIISNCKNKNENYSINTKIKRIKQILNKKDNKNLKENINIFSSKEFNKNNINYNMVSCITKKYTINVNKKLLLLQRSIKSFLFLKKAKKDYYITKDCLFINKTSINKLFFITKKLSNENECLEKIIKFQKFYKTRFNYFKNNIIKFTISTEREKEEIKLPEKIKSNLNINWNYNNLYNINNILKENQQTKNLSNYENNINTIESDSFAKEKNNNLKNSKHKRNCYEISHNKIILLSDLIEKNRKPVQQIIGNYYEKIRVDSKIFAQFLNKANKSVIILNKENRGNYISKYRLKNNISLIILIQKKIKSFLNLKNIQNSKNIIFKRPLNQNYFIYNDNIRKESNIEEITNKKTLNNNKKGNLDENENLKANLNKSSKNSKLNNLFDLYEDKEDESSYFEEKNLDFTDFVGAKIYTIYNKNNIIRQPHMNMNNYYYMSKIRIYNNEEEEVSSAKEYESIKKELKQRRLNYKKISKENSNYCSQTSNSNSNYYSSNKEKINKKIYKDSNIVNKEEKNKNSKNKTKKKIRKQINNFDDKNDLDFENNNLFNEEKYVEFTPRFNIIDKNICYIEKIRFKNKNIIAIIKDYFNKKKIEKKNKDERKNNEFKNKNNILNLTYKKPKNDRCYISKYLAKTKNSENNLNRNRNDGSLLKEIMLNNTDKEKSKNIIYYKNIYNNNNSNFFNNNVNLININKNITKSINHNNNNLFNKNSYNNNQLNEKESNYSSYSNYSEKISNGNNIVCHDSRNGKIHFRDKKTFNKININNKINYFHNKINYINFIQLLNLFIIKNTQEFIYYKLFKYYQKKYNKSNNKLINIYNNCKFKFPFYISSLKRLFKYILKENLQNKRVKNFLNLIFPSMNKNKSFYYLLICLTIENRKKLINTNLYDANNEKSILIQFLDDFTNFDKNISNKKFINDKIEKAIFYNTNIFTLIRFIDDEFIKLNRGVYCLNCYQFENICRCSDKHFNKNNYISNGSEEDILDLDLNEDTESKPGRIKINYFVDEKDKDKSKIEDFHNANNEIIFIKKKPKINLFDYANKIASNK